MLGLQLAWPRERNVGDVDENENENEDDEDDGGFGGAARGEG